MSEFLPPAFYLQIFQPVPNRLLLVSEGFSPAPSATNALNYTFDGNNPGLGVRLDAKIGTGAPASWEFGSTPNSLGQVTSDQTAASAGGAVPASGTVSGIGQVNILVDGVSQGSAAITGGNSWSFNLDLAAGQHTLTATAVDPSGLNTTTANSTFTVGSANSNQPAGTVTSGYDGDGNVTSRSWTNGVAQTLTWDAFDRLIGVSQRDNSDNGYDWTAVYDGLGRRISTTNQPVVSNVAKASTVTASIYDPQVEFLEIGVSVNGVKAWKVYGPDLNGVYGGMQGTGGLEAVVMDSGGAATGVLNDYFGNGVATISGGTITWNTTRVGGYGPLPDSSATPLTDATQLAQATVWRSHRIDPTGFYYLGARYYEPTSGRFLSPDPKGQAASMSLYDFCHGDPVNNFDADGRCPDNGNNAPSLFPPGWNGFDPSSNGQNPADPNNAAEIAYASLLVPAAYLTYQVAQNWQVLFIATNLALMPGTATVEEPPVEPVSSEVIDAAPTAQAETALLNTPTPAAAGSAAGAGEGEVIAAEIIEDVAPLL